MYGERTQYVVEVTLKTLNQRALKESKQRTQCSNAIWCLMLTSRCVVKMAMECTLVVNANIKIRCEDDNGMHFGGQC